MRIFWLIATLCCTDAVFVGVAPKSTVGEPFQIQKTKSSLLMRPKMLTRKGQPPSIKVFSSKQEHNGIVDQKERISSDINLSYHEIPSINSDENIYHDDCIEMLFDAVNYGRVVIMDELLSKCKNDINHKDETGETLLHKVIRNEDLDMARLLLFFGADPNVVSGPMNMNALLLASYYNTSIDFVETIFEYGADLHAVSQETGRNALSMAIENYNYGLSKWFLQHGVQLQFNATFNPLVIVAVIYRDVMMTKLILAHLCRPSDVDFPNKSGETPLMLAASHGHLDIVKLLLSFGANIYAVSKFGDTPLSMAYHSPFKKNRAVANLLRAVLNS